VASPISVTDITSPKYISDDSSESPRMASPKKRQHLIARSANDQEFPLDLHALKDMLRSDIEKEFQSKFDELKAILLEKERKEEQQKRRRKRKKKKKKKRRRKSRDRGHGSTKSVPIARSKSASIDIVNSVEMDGVLPTKRNPVSNPQWQKSSSQTSRGHDSSDSENERSDFELAVTPKDLHLDDIDVDSNVSDDYAKSSDLQRGSNGSPSKESNDANDQYLSNDEMNEFNETLNMIPIENAVIEDDEMMTFQV